VAVKFTVAPAAGGTKAGLNVAFVTLPAASVTVTPALVYVPPVPRVNDPVMVMVYVPLASFTEVTFVVTTLVSTGGGGAGAVPVHGHYALAVPDDPKRASVTTIDRTRMKFRMVFHIIGRTANAG